MWKSASYVTQYSSILLHKYVICVWYKAAMYMPQVALLVKLFASTNTQTHSEINQIKMRKQTQQSQNHKRAATLRFRDTEAYNLQKLKKFTWSTHTNEFSTPSPGGISGVNTPNFCTYPLAFTPDNPPNSSQGALNVAFTVLRWIMTRHDTRHWLLNMGTHYP